MQYQANNRSQNVVIIGGGPAGLAMALVLAKRGWTNISILEQRPSVDYYEPDKSFNYLIDGRGQELTDLLGLTQKLSQIGVSSQEFFLTAINPDGRRKTTSLPIVDPNRKTAYWVTRRAFVSLLYDEIQQNWQDKITVVFNTKCVEIQKNPEVNNNEILEVVTQINNETVIKYTPSLLVGCDGIGSIVRNTLNAWDTSNTQGFEMKAFPSPSTGLRYKVLSLPPQFPLDKDGEEFSVSEMAYAFRSNLKDSKYKLSLGLLPVKDPNQPRTANFITKPGHGIWELKTSDDVYNFLETSFPQLAIRKIISPTEVERFVASEGGAFPSPQYCPRLYFLLNPKDTKSSGIVLLGDAIHCFPPDIGQGVNSALQDVCVLNKALSQTNDDLTQALPLYQSWRLPDLEPLIRLAQTSFPWQYNQDPIGKLLWSINFFTRLALSKVLPLIYSPPSFFLIQNHQLSYRQIWEKAQRTTSYLYVLILLLIGALLALGLRANFN